MKEVNAPKCGRENDLIGFLYGELDEIEALAFQRHLHECTTCKTELASFGDVRESVVAWRNESLSSAGFPTQIMTSSPTGAAEVRPSAMAALREFFSLSPLWMKGAVAFAAILFCLFAGLAVARLRDKRPAVMVQAPATPSQQELNALVDQRVQQELKRIKDSNEQAPNSSVTKNNSPQKNPVKRIANRSEMAANSGRNARRPLSKTEREQLAADLRLVSAKSESDLDLLGDRINQ